MTGLKFPVFASKLEIPHVVPYIFLRAARAIRKVRAAQASEKLFGWPTPARHSSADTLIDAVSAPACRTNFGDIQFL